MKWLWIILALLYFLSPYDLIPGVHGVGWIDDIIILILLFRYLARIKKSGPSGPDPFGSNGRQQQTRAPGGDRYGEAPNQPRTPHEILNIPPDADQESIKTAYRKLANQYHPDKVAHLGKEFQELADRKFKEIQDAYQKLIH